MSVIKSCDNCRYDETPTGEPPCDTCFGLKNWMPVELTYYDNIKSKSLHEMAELIAAIISQRDRWWLERLREAGITEITLYEMPAQTIAAHEQWLSQKIDWKELLGNE